MNHVLPDSSARNPPEDCAGSSRFRKLKPTKLISAMDPRTIHSNHPTISKSAMESISAQTSCPNLFLQEDEREDYGSSTTDPLGQPLCFCEVEAQLRYSSTTRNPGRPFLGCPNYNTKGLPYCKYFKWVEEDQYKKFDLRETHNELLRIKKELKSILDDIEKSKIELRKRADEIEMREIALSNRNEEVVNKELVLLVREAEIRCSRTLLRAYWALAFVVTCYLSCP